MAYPYPADFPQASRARVTVAKIEAGKTLNLVKEFDVGSDLEKGVRQFVLEVFSVFAEEALELGRCGIWTVDQIDSQAHEFLRQLTIEWCHDKFGHPAGSMICPDDGALTPETIYAYKTSFSWQKYENDLLDIAKGQVCKDLVAPRVEIRPNADIDPSLGKSDEKERRARLLAEYKSTTSNPSNKRIYEAKNSGIHKPDFYAWLKGDLSLESAMTINFERFLRLKKPPFPRKQKAEN
jgi:hypothetical protein